MVKIEAKGNVRWEPPHKKGRRYLIQQEDYKNVKKSVIQSNPIIPPYSTALFTYPFEL